MKVTLHKELDHLIAAERWADENCPNFLRSKTIPESYYVPEGWDCGWAKTECYFVHENDAVLFALKWS